MIVALAFSGAAHGQDTKPEGQPQPNANQPQDVRTNVLRQLGLSPDQVQKIRRVNMERKPLMEEANRRLREANRTLNEAIYADQVNDEEVQARLKELQLAQAEVAKIRFTNELSVRRILTSEQLVRFRDLRQRFEQVRQNIDSRRAIDGVRHNIGQDPGNSLKLREGKQQLRPVVRPNQQRPQL